MNVVILQNSNETPPGSVLDFFEHRGITPKLIRLYAGEKLPNIHEVDWVIALGGGMNVDETEKHPYLLDEKAFLSQAVAVGKTCLGLCLGGQLLSQCLGGKVSKHTFWEVGWHPIDLDDGQKLTVFQWHQDAFTLPQTSRRFATNAITDNQGFIFGDFVVGLQFHPEATEAWIKSCLKDNDYPVGPHVQDRKTIEAGLDHHLPVMRAWFFKLLENMQMKTNQRIMNHKTAKAAETV